MDQPSLRARTQLLGPLHESITTVVEGGMVVVSLRGSTGSGKTTVLDDLSARLNRAGIATRRAEAFRADRSHPGAVASVLKGEGLPADEPVALLVDEAQWTDATSLGWLHLMLTTRRAGMLVVLAREERDRRLDVERLAAAAGRRGTYLDVRLERLTALDIVDMCAGTEEERATLAGSLIERSHGLADELDRLVAEAVATGALVRNGEKLSQVADLPRSDPGITPQWLGSQQLRLFEAVALSLRPLSLAEIQYIVGGTGEDALQIAEALGDTGLVRQTAQGLTVGSRADAARAAEEMGELRRAALYSDLADAAAAVGPAVESPGLVGVYCLRAARFGDALQRLAEAGLELAERQHFGEALPLVEQALTAYEAAGAEDPELEGALRLARAEAYEFAGWPDRAAADLDVATRRLSGRARIRALGYAAAVADDRQRPQQAEQYLSAALYEATTLGEHAMVGSLRTLLARILQRLGFAAESDAALESGLTLLEAHGDDAQRFRGRYNHGWVAFDRGRALLATSIFEDCVDRAPDLGGPGFVGNVESWLARARFVAGEPEEAIAARASAIDLADRDGSTGPIFLSHMALAEGAALYGQYETSLSAADEMLGVVLRQLPAWENAARFLRAQALWRLGRVEEASTEAARAIATTPDGVNGERWHHKIRVLQLRIDAELGEPWPRDEVVRLTDELLGARRYASAIALMTEDAAQRKDPETASRAAALALQVGAPMAAAEAIAARNLWQSPDAAAVIGAVKRIENKVPNEWRSGWAALPWVAPALAADTVAEEDYQASVDRLERRVEAALAEAGLHDVEQLLSPAQRQARGLRRHGGRSRRWLAPAAAAAVAAVVVVAAVLVLRPESTGTTDPVAATPETTRLDALDPTRVASQWRYLDSSAGGPPRAGLGISGPVTGYFWKFPTGGRIRSSPVLRGKTLIFGSDDGFVYGVDITTGRSIWRYETRGRVQGAVTVAEVPMQGQASGGIETPPLAFFGSTDGNLYARDPVLASAATTLLARVGEVVGAPVVVGSTVYVGSRNGYLYSVDVVQRAVNWVFPAGNEILGSPALGDGYIWVGNIDGDLFGINPSDGSEHCSVRTMGRIATAPLIYEQIVYVGTAVNGVFGYTTADCALTRKAPSITTEAPVLITPVIASVVAYDGEISGIGDVLVVAEDRFMRAYERETGRFIWQFATEAQIRSSPAIAEGSLYFGDDGGVFYALDIGTGVELWRFQTGGTISAAPALAPGMVFVASHDGTLYAIGNGTLPEATDRPAARDAFVAAPATPDPADDALPPGSAPLADPVADSPPPTESTGDAVDTSSEEPPVTSEPVPHSDVGPNAS